MKERRRLLRFMFRGNRASYDRKTGLSISFDVRPEWQPYVDAVLAAEKRPLRRRRLLPGRSGTAGVKHAEVVTARLVQEDNWLRLSA